MCVWRLCCLPSEKLRGVFEALLANPASRTLMRQLLKGAGMPFNEEAFEEQVKVGWAGVTHHLLGARYLTGPVVADLRAWQRSPRGSSSAPQHQA